MSTVNYPPNLSEASLRFWDMAEKGMFFPFHVTSTTVSRNAYNPEIIREEVEMQEFYTLYGEVYIFDLFDPIVVKVLTCDAAELPVMIHHKQVPFLNMIAKARIINGIL